MAETAFELVPTSREAGAERRCSRLPSAALRRKEQNRINQRNSREKRQSQLCAAPPSKWVIYTANETELDHAFRRSALQEPSSPQDLVLRSRFCDLGPAERNEFVTMLRQQAVEGATQQILRCERLLSVAQYNIILAAGTNAASLGLTMEALSHDILSPFNTHRTLAASLPPSLCPTRLQRMIPHHPWIDLFPSPSIRDILLRRMGEYNEDQICNDMFSSCGEKGQLGVLVWGDPADLSSYEMSEDLLTKYPWLINDCSYDIVRFTNHWRRKRGEKRLVLPFEVLRETT
ncbi:hypothetical protein BR93DRAFT_884440 [Coniochaeta sp. PMI_546]|nr:hypothetical protein BR93DRAFT_884440 [Coniochaeta sp. PMI_546]